MRVLLLALVILIEFARCVDEEVSRDSPTDNLPNFKSKKSKNPKRSSIDPAAAQALFDNQPHVTQLKTPEELASVHFSNNVWVIEYYVKWCDFCIGYVPIYSNMAEKLKNLVKFATIDCELPAMAKVCKQEKIKEYPTIKVYPTSFDKNTQGYKKTQVAYPLDYKNLDDLETWILSHLENTVARADLSTFGDLMDLVGPNLVILFDKAVHPSPEYKALAIEYRYGNPFVKKNVLLCLSLCEELAKRMDVKPSTWPVLLGLRRQPDDINQVKGDAFAGDLKDFDAVKEFIDGYALDPTPIYERAQKRKEAEQEAKRNQKEQFNSML